MLDLLTGHRPGDVHNDRQVPWLDCLDISPGRERQHEVSVFPDRPMHRNGNPHRLTGHRQEDRQPSDDLVLYGNRHARVVAIDVERVGRRKRVEELVAVIDHDLEARLDALRRHPKYFSGAHLRPTANATRIHELKRISGPFENLRVA